MTQDNFRWNYQRVEALVKTRNSDEFAQGFVIHKNNGYKLNKLWEQIGSDLDFTISAKNLSCKYKDLLSIYRKELTESKRAGASPSTWKYWNLFRDNVNENVDGAPLVKVELGSGNQMVLNVLKAQNIFK